MPDWVWFIVSPIVLIGYGYYRWQQRKQTRDDYAELAHRLGWDYAPSDDSLVGRYQGQPFDWGRWQKAEHVFRGEHRGYRLTAFEYSFRMEETDRHGDERTERNFYQVITIALTAPKPFLELGPRGFFAGVARSVGWRAEETGDARFDDAFTLDTKDSAFAGAMLSDEVRAWLLSDPRTGDNPVRINGNEILTWRQGELDVSDLEHRVDFLCDLLDRTPSLTA
ncbi:hypothetical protein [Amycolatopsis palatopharyngis]|uniref:hypothetical protein n=1 Tax=Amycolatopsis palatopharyngis TaxID=187982 RepID=UPI000E24059B|nr:hypothetical protein [Amycolatopsis palatopharyngis]